MKLVNRSLHGSVVTSPDESALYVPVYDYGDSFEIIALAPPPPITTGNSTQLSTHARQN